MQYRRLGANGPVVSRVAFGNSLTAGNQLADDTALACVRAALDAGITTFDTADAYAEGRAEELLGRALAGVDRDSVVVCTKVGRGGGPGPGALSRELDVPLVSNQPQYNLLWRVIEAEVLPACTALGIGQMVWSPLAGGVLTGKYRPGRRPPAGSRAVAARGGEVSIQRWNFLSDEVLSAVARAGDLAAEAGLTLPQLALAWTLRSDSVATAVIGASSPDQIPRTRTALTTPRDPDLLHHVDEALAPAIIRDPALTLSRMLRAKSRNPATT